MTNSSPGRRNAITSVGTSKTTRVSNNVPLPARRPILVRETCWCSSTALWCSRTEASRSRAVVPRSHRARTGIVLMSSPTMSLMPGTSASRPETVEPKTTSRPWRMPPSVTAHALCTATLSGTPAARAAASMSPSSEAKSSPEVSTPVSANRPDGVCPSATSDGPGSPASCSRHTRSLSSPSRAASARTCPGKPSRTCTLPGAWYSASNARSIGGTDQPSATMWCTVCTKTFLPGPVRTRV